MLWVPRHRISPCSPPLSDVLVGRDTVCDSLWLALSITIAPSPLPIRRACVYNPAIIKLSLLSATYSLWVNHIFYRCDIWRYSLSLSLSLSIPSRSLPLPPSLNPSPSLSHHESGALRSLFTRSLVIELVISTYIIITVTLTKLSTVLYNSYTVIFAQYLTIYSITWMNFEYSEFINIVTLNTRSEKNANDIETTLANTSRKDTTAQC